MSGPLNLNRQSLELRTQESSLLPAVGASTNAEHASVSCSTTDTLATSGVVSTSATTPTNTGLAPTQRRRQRKGITQRQDSWFRHSMPPALTRDFESIENLTQHNTNGLDEQLAASLSGRFGASTSASLAASGVQSGVGSGSLTLCGFGIGSLTGFGGSGQSGSGVGGGMGNRFSGGINLNSANSNLGFIDSDESNINSPITPLASHSASIYGGLQQQGSVSATSMAGTVSSNAIANGGGGGGAAGGCRRHRSKRRKDSRASVFSKLSGMSVRSRASALAARAGLHMTASFLRKKRKEYEGE